MNKVDLSVTLAGMTMKNPVAVASGTFGFGREYGQFYDLSELGAICVKGLTAQPQRGQSRSPHCGDPHGDLELRGPAKPRSGRLHYP